MRNQYGYEADQIGIVGQPGTFRVYNPDDSRIATCYLEKNAALIVEALKGQEFALAAGQLLTEARQAIAVLEGKVERLREALEPFAYQAKIIDEADEIHRLGGVRMDASLFRFDGSYTAISLGDLRRAREALK